jgi:hypothetical protein
VSAEHEFVAMGFPAPSWARLAKYALLLAPGLVLAASGIDATLPLGKNSVTFPIMVPWLIVLGAVFGWQIASHRSRRYMIDPERVRVLGGVLKEKLLAEVARSSASEILLWHGIPAIRHETGALLLEGVGPDAFGELRRVWPEVSVRPTDPDAPRKIGRRAQLISWAFFLLILLAPASEIVGWYQRSCESNYRALVAAVSAAVARADVTVAKALGEPRPGGLSAGMSDGGGRFLLVGYGRAWYHSAEIAPDRQSNSVDVLTVCHYRWNVFFGTMGVEVHTSGAPEDERFVKELSKELDAAGVSFTVVRKRP